MLDNYIMFIKHIKWIQPIHRISKLAYYSFIPAVNVDFRGTGCHGNFYI